MLIWYFKPLAYNKVLSTIRVLLSTLEYLIIYYYLPNISSAWSIILEKVVHTLFVSRYLLWLLPRFIWKSHLLFFYQRSFSLVLSPWFWSNTQGFRLALRVKLDSVTSERQSQYLNYHWSRPNATDYHITEPTTKVFRYEPSLEHGNEST